MLSAASTIESPTDEPVELVAAKRFLRIDGTSLDGDIELLVMASREDVETRTGLRLMNQIVEIQADAFDDLAFLPVGPVRAVAEISYVDPAGSEQLLDPAAYQLVGAELERGIAPAFGGRLPAVQAVRGAIRVRLEVGYGDTPDAIPAQLRWAMLALISGKFNDRPVDIEPQIVNLRIGA